ncbi:MAG: nitroreductase family protein [Elusimicrobiota bacterium]|jgi:nitroreductase
MTGLNSFMDLARERRSVRDFLPDPVPHDLMQRLIDAASWAPSAGNRQDWEFIVVESAAAKRELASAVRKRWDALLAKAQSGTTESLKNYASNFDWFANAPALVAVTSKTPADFLEELLGGTASAVSGGRLSAAMAAQNLMLSAHAAGLGSCCLTGPLAAQEEMKPILGISRRREIVCLIAVGRPLHNPPAPVRKPLEKISRYIE